LQFFCCGTVKCCLCSLQRSSYTMLVCLFVWFSSFKAVIVSRIWHECHFEVFHFMHFHILGISSTTPTKCTFCLIHICTRWFKYVRDWFVCKQAALRSSCAACLHTNQSRSYLNHLVPYFFYMFQLSYTILRENLHILYSKLSAFTKDTTLLV